MKTSASYLPLLLAATFAATPATTRAQAPSSAPAGAFAYPAPATIQPFLGVVTERICDDLRHQLPALKPGAGLIVRELVAGSPAAQAQVEQLDVLLSWNDQVLVHPAQLQVLVASAKPGDQVSLEYLHHGVPAKAQITLAGRAGPAQPLETQTHPQGAAPAASPLEAALKSAMQNPELMQQAAAVLGQSGIDPAMIAGALEGLDLKHIDLAALAPEALRDSKIVVITPDGNRQEITLAEAVKDGPKLEQILKHVDLSKIDPVALLGSKILLINPDGTQQEFTPADVLKALAEKLK